MKKVVRTKAKTDLQHVKITARELLYTDIVETRYSPLIVQHPFTSSGIVMIPNYKNGEPINMIEDKNAQSEWRYHIVDLINNSKDVYGIYPLINKPYRMTFLKFCSPYLSRKEFSDLLSDAWTSSENPNRDPNFTLDELLDMFKMADKQVMMSEEDNRYLQKLPSTLTVYRGVTDSNSDNSEALSWTTEKDVAEWFSKRYGQSGTVLEAQIDKEHIYAFFGGESEVIVDPRYLTDICMAYCVIKCFFSNIKRGGILLTQIAVGSLHMFSLPREYSEGFTAWAKQIIALCFTTFMQTTLLLLGVLTMQTHALLGLGVMMAANEVPRIAQQFGLDTSVRINMISAVHTTTTVINLGRAIARK